MNPSCRLWLFDDLVHLGIALGFTGRKIMTRRRLPWSSHKACQAPSAITKTCGGKVRLAYQHLLYQILFIAHLTLGIIGSQFYSAPKQPYDVLPTAGQEERPRRVTAALIDSRLFLGCMAVYRAEVVR